MRRSILSAPPFALPYFAFLSQLDRLAPEQTLVALAAYNTAYALPFLAVPLSVALSGSTVLSALGRVGAVVDRLSRLVPPVLLGLVGGGPRGGCGPLLRDRHWADLTTASSVQTAGWGAQQAPIPAPWWAGAALQRGSPPNRTDVV